MTAAEPAITAVIAVKDGERYLASAIESVLSQTRPPRRVIVVDDGSSDASAAIARSFPAVDLVSRPNGGPAAARNTALRVCNTAYVAIHDADDIAAPTRFERQAGLLDERPDVAGVLGRQHLLCEPGAPLPVWVGASDTSAPPATLLARRSMFERIGLYDESLRIGEDSDLLLRAFEAGLEIAVLDDIVVHRRIHDANLTGDGPSYERAMFAILQRRIGRKRAARALTTERAERVEIAGEGGSERP